MPSPRPEETPFPAGLGHLTFHNGPLAITFRLGRAAQFLGSETVPASWSDARPDRASALSGRTPNGFAVIGYRKISRSPVNHLQQQLGRLPQTIVADAGYGSEENYAYLDKHRRTAVVQFNTYRLEKTKKWKSQIQRVDNWTYDETTDAWVCPAETRLSFVRTKEETTESGYVVHLREYQAHDCPTCALRDQCTNATRPPTDHRGGSSRPTGAVGRPVAAATGRG